MSDTTVDGVPDRGPVVFSVTTATLILATVFVAARMISRAGIVRKVSWDDYIILLAWLIAFFLSFSIDIGKTEGLGRHDANIDPNDRPALRKSEYVFSVLYVRPLPPLSSYSLCATHPCWILARQIAILLSKVSG